MWKKKGEYINPTKDIVLKEDRAQNERRIYMKQAIANDFSSDTI